MGAVASPVRKGAAVLALILAPIGIHVAMATQRGLALAGILVVAEAGLIAWIALSFLRGPQPALGRLRCCAGSDHSDLADGTAMGSSRRRPFPMRSLICRC